MALARVLIEVEGGEKIQPSATTRVFFNPTGYTLTKRVNWKESPARALDLPPVQFDGGGPRSLGLSLQFDSYEDKSDVRGLTKQLAKLAEVAEGKDRPPVCRVMWGPDAGSPYAGLPFTGVVENVTQKFTLFLEDGTPVRATLDISFKEIEDPARQLKRTPRKRSSPIQARERVVAEGDTLWSIAAAEYGDARRWRPIASANGIVNPRTLTPGTALTIPPVE
jgi:hypothetical protein